MLDKNISYAKKEQCESSKQSVKSILSSYVSEGEPNREKYTSTMDVMLRRQIKIACATRGIMFAKFVEDACREKLAKEGFR